MSTQATVKETAAAVRATLKTVHPATKFSVRMSTGTGHGWLSVSWSDGPTDDDLRPLLDQFCSLRFDGMDDAYHATGVTQWSCSGINTSRTISDQFLATALPLVQHDSTGEPFICTPTGRVITARYPAETDQDLARRYCRLHAA